MSITPTRGNNAQKNEAQKSQVDGINDSDEENSEESINAMTGMYKISVKEKNTAKEVINDLTNNEV